jgi:hypothetical protein
MIEQPPEGAGRISRPLVDPTSSELAHELRAWIPALVRAIRACRLYPAKSGMREQHVAAASAGLARVLAAHPVITLGIRDGAFFSGEEEVFVDDDLRTGPTHFLTGHAIFELTFAQGMGAAELETFASILAEDPGHRRRLGEDLSTLLWRFDLEHVRTRTVDVLAAAVRSDGAAPTERRRRIADDHETERLLAEEAEIVRSLSTFTTEEGDRDIAAEIDHSVASPDAWHGAIDADHERFRAAVAIAERRLSKRYLDAIRLDLASTRAHDHLVARLSELLIEALSAEPDPSSPGPALTLLVRLFEGMLRDGQFARALHLLERLRTMASGLSAGATHRLVGLVVQSITSETTAHLALSALDHAAEHGQTASVLALLRGLGDAIVPYVLSGLDRLEQDEARRVAAGLAIELTPRRRSELHRTLRAARPEVALALLEASLAATPAERAELIAIGLGSTSAIVRVEALRGLMAYGPGKPDELLGRALRDPDGAVRTVAIRAIAIRNTSAGATQLAQLAVREDILGRDPAELRSILVAWASIAGSATVPTLDKLLTRVSALTGGHRASAIESVAFALSVVDTAAARELLARGARSLNPRLRAACKAALEQGGRSELARLGSSPLESQPHGEGGARRTWPGGQYRPDQLAEWPVISTSRAELIPAVQSSPLLTIPARPSTADIAPLTPAPKLGPSPLLVATRARAPEIAVPEVVREDEPVELPLEALALERLPSDALFALPLEPEPVIIEPEPVIIEPEPVVEPAPREAPRVEALRNDDVRKERFPDLTPPTGLPPVSAELAALDWGRMAGDLGAGAREAASYDLSSGTGSTGERDVTSEVPRPRVLRAWSGITPLPEELAGPGGERS